VAEMRLLLAAAQEEKLALQQELAQARSQMLATGVSGHVEEELARMHEALARLQQEGRTGPADAEQHLERLTAEMHGLRTNMAALQASHSALASDLVQAQTTSREQQDGILRREQELLEARLELGQLQAREEASLASRAELQALLAAATESLGELQAQVALLRTELSTATTSAAQQLGEQQQRLQAALAHTADLTHIREQQDQQLAEAREHQHQQRRQFEAALSESRQEISRLQALLEDADTRADVATSLREQAAAEAQDHLSVSRARILALEQALAALKVQFDDR
jgi:chromosome segregation ATPase